MNNKITDIKEIAKLVRKDIATAIKAGELPTVKVSVTLSRFAGGQSLSVYVTQVPEGFTIFNAERVRWESENPYKIASYDAPESAQQRYTAEASKVEETLKGIVATYNWNNSDLQTDYFDVNFYEHVGFHWKLENAHSDAIVAAHKAG